MRRLYSFSFTSFGESKLVEIEHAGCFHWNEYVFRDNDDYEIYKPIMPTKGKSGKSAKTDFVAYRKWRTWQMSDHLPLWEEIKMDFTQNYLNSLKTKATALTNFAPASGPHPDSHGA